MATRREKARGALTVEVAALTNRGSARPRNEDCIAVGAWMAQESMTSARSFASRPPVVCVVGDGMGGHAAGQLAGRLVTERLGQLLHDGKVREIEPAVRKVNAELFARMREMPETAGMGAAIVGLLASDGKIGVFNVGDSRAYRVEAEKLVQLSKDDSADKDWTPSSLFARSGVLTQALGGYREGVDPHLHIEPARSGATYLLCCDGLYETLDERQILACIGRDLATSAETMLRTALKHFAADNVSILLARLVSR